MSDIRAIVALLFPVYMEIYFLFGIFAVRDTAALMSNIIIPPDTKYMGLYWIHAVRPSVNISCEYYFSETII